MWKCLHTKTFCLVAFMYLKRFPHCYYGRVVKETGKLHADIVEQGTKKEKLFGITLKAKAEIQQLLERMQRCWETNHT